MPKRQEVPGAEDYQSDHGGAPGDAARFENELRRLEPYFVKQAWNWQQLYDRACTRNPHPGGCSRSLTRWFFYPTFSKCYAFVYGGCGGTANRFSTQKECLKSCVPRQLPLSPPPVIEEPTLAPPPDSDQLNGLLASNDNETIKAVQRLAEPLTTLPTTSGASSGAPSDAPVTSTQVKTSTKAQATAVTPKPAGSKAKREFPHADALSVRWASDNAYSQMYGFLWWQETSCHVIWSPG
ncbi:uncharacterized protein LOC119110147 [Pollicipes pollicipes]|uniref:uncharacterized protein LOC119110147 n=1 Tax=Pollicipes pollicipes TaxID=41117 RepID=UPI001884F5FC|nr:uncharacterized protein LOC119110147 [Pollicipes pollicipes]